MTKSISIKTVNDLLIQLTEDRNREPNKIIMSPRVYQAHVNWYYNWANKIHWNILIAPKLTRFLSKVDKYKWRIVRAWWALKGED